MRGGVAYVSKKSGSRSGAGGFWLRAALQPAGRIGAAQVMRRSRFNFPRDRSLAWKLLGIILRYAEYALLFHEKE